MGCFGFDYKSWTWKKNPYIWLKPPFGPGMYTNGWVDMSDFASFQVAVKTSSRVSSKLQHVFQEVCWWRMGYGCPIGPASNPTVPCDRSFSSLFDVNSNARAGDITVDSSDMTLPREGLTYSQYIERNREAAMRL